LQDYSPKATGHESKNLLLYYQVILFEKTMPSATLRPVSVKLDAKEHLRLKALAETRQRKPHSLM
jgi:hypothetical protein